MQKLIRASTVALAMVLATAAPAGEFIDTRLSFVFADDNVLAGPGETTPSSPNARFGAGNQNTQFYDNFNTKYSGFETLSNLVLYKKSTAFFEGLETEAAFNVLFEELETGAVKLKDNSSYLRLNYTPPTWKKGEGISFTGFPVSSDRFRLGYAYRISWGGSSIFPTRSTSDTTRREIPGARLQVTRDTWYAYVGAKTALITDELLQGGGEEQTNYGFLAGAGIDLLPTLRLEANGGYFQKGIIPGLADAGYRAPVNAAGGSAQVVWHVGMPVGQSVDLTLYRNDPDQHQRFFKLETYPGGASWTVSAEATFLVQSLEDPDVFARTVAQPASAAALQARVKFDYLRAHLLGLYRTLSFMQFNGPGFPPFKDYPDNTILRPELFIAFGADYHFPQWHFTPGFILGVQQPASFTPPSTILGGNNPPAGLVGGRTVVVREVGNPTILPSNCNGQICEALPVFSAKTTFRWDLSDSVAAIGEVYYTWDNNRTTFASDLAGIGEPTFEEPNALGFNMILQARF